MPSEYLVDPFSTFVGQAAGVGAADTSFVVTDASLFPTTLPYRILVDAEVMMLTAIDGGTNTFTVTRAQSSTVATVHMNNAPVSTLLTAEGILANSGGGGGVSPCGGFGVPAATGLTAVTTGWTVLPCTLYSILEGACTLVNAPSTAYGFLPGVAGTYLITATVSAASGAGTVVYAGIAVTGANNNYAEGAVVAGIGSATVAVKIALSATQTVELQAKAGGATLNIDGLGSYLTITRTS